MKNRRTARKHPFASIAVVSIAAILFAITGGTAEGSTTVTTVTDPGSGPAGSPASPPLLSTPPPASMPRAIAGELPLPHEASAAERSASRTEFEGYRRESAVSLAERLFGAGVPQWHSPQSESSGRITGYVGESLADETLPNGQKAIIDSSIPLRSSVGSGKEEPVSLTLSGHGQVYEESNPLVPVAISKAPTGGAAFGFPYDVRIAPSQHAEPESSELVGNSVFYPDVATDTDFLLEPTPSGVEASWQLISQASSQANSLTFSLPAGASLVLSKSVEGAAEVLMEGAQIFFIRPAAATEADGTSLPVSYTISGDTLTTHVDLSGSVDFPVLVDPTISQGYGGSSDYWTGWNTAGTSGDYFEGGGGNAGVLAGIHPSSPAATWAAWSVYAPGYASGEGKITRVDVTGMQHLYSGNSWLEAGIAESNGSPVWTYNGTNPAETHSGALLTSEQYSGKAAAFCAQGEGGADGKSPGLCNFAYGGNYFHLSVYTQKSQAVHQSAMIEGTTVKYLDTSHMYTSFASGSTVRGQPNVLDSTSNWLGPKSGGLFEFSGYDPAFGVLDTGLRILKAGKWETAENTYYGPCNLVCPASQSTALGYKEVASDLTEGEDSMYAGSEDPAGVDTEVSGVVKVDATPPHSIAISGVPMKGETVELTESEAHLSVEATDGEGSTPSSGVQWINVGIDKRQQGALQGRCSPGPCTAHGEWALNGAGLGAGPHTLEIQAEDYAGNLSPMKTYTLNVSHASPVAIGPGSVDPQSGDFALEATDVTFGGGSGALTVSRHYDSRNVKEGAGGTLGPQWTIGLGSPATLEVLPNESVLVADQEGLTVFTKSASEYVSPPGDSSLALTYGEGKYKLEDKMKGTTTTFTLPKNATSETTQWVATASSGPDATNEITDAYESVTIAGKSVTEPVLELAPHPALSCPPEEAKWEEWQPGCRGLFFKYTSAGSGSAKGEQRSEWGIYEGRLSEVEMVAYNPATKKMQKTAVAKYEYDGQGRLRAEYNPATSFIKTTYGYDTEGHVTAITPPGEEPWLLTYGTIEGDPGTGLEGEASAGRLIKADRVPASATLWEGRLPENTEAPKVSGSPIVGNLMSVSNGVWTHGAVGYAYYWEDCNASGGECVRIPGATDATYKPGSADVGHTLVAQTAAMNSGGTVVAASAATTVVASTGSATEGEHRGPAPGWTVEYNVPVSGSGAPYELGRSHVEEAWGQMDFPTSAAAIFAPEEERGWPASSYTGATVYYMDSQARTVNVVAPTGGISTTEYNANNDVERTLTAEDLATALKEAKPAEAAAKLDTKNKYNASGTELMETLGPEHDVRIPGGKESEARSRTVYEYDKGAPGGKEYGLVTSETVGALLPSGEEVEPRTTTTSYSGQSNRGWELRAPTSVTTNPGGLNLTTTTEYSEVGNVEVTKTPEGTAAKEGADAYLTQFGSTGSESEKLSNPSTDAVDASGDVWVTDRGGDRVEEFSASGAFMKALGGTGTGSGQFEEPLGLAINSSTKNVYVADEDTNRVSEFNEKGEFLRAFGYGVSNGEAKLQTCTSSCKSGIAGAGAGQFNEPEGVAIDSSGNVWIADYQNNRVDEFTEKGEFTAAFGFGVLNGEAKLQTCATTCKAGLAGTGSGEFHGPVYLAFAGGNLYVTDYVNDRVEEFNGSREYVAQFGSKGSGSGQFSDPSGIAAGPGGNLYVDDLGNNRIEEFTTNGTYVAQFGAAGTGNGQFKEPEGVAVNSSGDAYVVDGGNNRIQELSPAEAQGSHDTRTVYYSAKGEASVAACQNHPEWVNLPCQVGPVEQPHASIAPNLPVTTTAYSVWDQPETETTKFGTTTRTKTTTFDAAGRPLTTEETSTADTALPKVTDTYNMTNGLLATQSTTSEGKTKTIKSEYNNLGQLETYTDADGGKTSYTYNGYGQVEKVTTEKGAQTYAYEPSTGVLTTLTDSKAGAFTATYGLEGQLATESYPNGMTATYGYSPVGQATHLVYKKMTHCTTGCEWFTDSNVPAIHGEVTKQESSLAKIESAYDAAGRLTEVEETPTGKTCTARLYGYNEDSDRTSLTTRESATSKCATEGGTVAGHQYDEGDRLIDEGISYDGFGNITKLSAADAGGRELTTSYYVDGQAASQTQKNSAEQTDTLSYKLDPEERTRETIATGEKAGTVITHYAGPGSAVAWTTEGSERWTRNIPGIGGELAATESSTTSPVLLLHDLEGNVVGEAALSETEAKLISSYQSTEFGVPTSSKPPLYSWLGASGVKSELPFGAITQDGATYVPQLGQPMQTELPDTPTPVNSANTVVTFPTAPVAPGAAHQEANAEGAGCSGTNACASRHTRGGPAECSLQLVIGESGGQVYARGWMGCGGGVLARWSELEVCLVAEVDVETTGLVTGYGICGADGSGFNPRTGKTQGQPLVSTLYAGQQEKCAKEVTYVGWGWAWLPGLREGFQKYTPSFTCGESFLDRVWNIGSGLEIPTVRGPW